MNSRTWRPLQRLTPHAALWALALILSTLSVPAMLGQPTYTALNLGNGGGTFSVVTANGINNTGQVAGQGTVGTVQHAFLYSGGTMTDLGTLSGAGSSAASGIANNGNIAGTSPVGSASFLYSSGTMTNIGTLPGGSYSVAYGISNSGVVGFSTTASSGHAYLYSGGSMTDLGTLIGPSGVSVAYGANDSGQIVGSSQITSGVSTVHAFLYASGSMTDLGTLSGYTNSQANGISSTGRIVGVVYNSSTTTGHAFLYASGVMTDIGTLPGYAYSQATGINSSGQVVGVSYDPGHTTHPFVYANGLMTDLNTVVSGLGGANTLVSIGGINDSGQIAASDDNGHAYLLVPTIGEFLGPCNCSTPGQHSVGDPVTVSTGNLFEQMTDHTTSGQNALAFIRYYNGQGSFVGTFAGSIGTGWRTNYDRYLRIISSSSVAAERANGQQLSFSLTGSTWTPASDVDVTLTNSGTSWTLTDRDDTVETYTTTTAGNEALLNSIKLRNGYTQTLTYNGSNQLTSVSDSYSRSFSLTYNTDGTIHTVTTPDSTILTYGYNTVTGGKQLTSVTYPTSPTTSQTYAYANSSLPFALTSITDENGNTYATWTYDVSGRVLTSKLGTGANLTTLVYGSGTTTVTNALGVTDTYSLTPLQGVVKVTQISRAATSTTAAATETFTYDSSGYLASQTDWNGNQTTYTNNSHGLPTTINEAVSSPVARTTTITYNATFVHLPDSITTPGLTTSFTYDTNGNVLTRTLTDTTTNTSPYSTSGQTRTTTYTYGSFLLASVKTPNGNITSYGYDSSGALTSITDALSHVTHITSHTGGGLPLTVVDPNSVTTTLTYTPRQWLLTSSVSTGAGARTTTYAYDAAGNLTRTTLPDSSYIANTYDTAHRITKVTDALGNYVSYTLDALGDRTQTNTYDSTSTLKKQQSDSFDALGRLLVDTAGAGQTTTYTYDQNGNPLTVKDGNSHTTTNVYDALDRLKKSTNALAGVTQYVYDPHDKLVNLSDPLGHTTIWIRDGEGEVTEEYSPDRSYLVYYYDSDGNLTQKLDAASNVMNQTFDALDRTLTTTYPADSTLNVAYTYDQTGTGFTFGIGRLTSLTDQAGSLTRAYDERGNLLTDKRTNGTTVLTTGYTYDPASRTASIAYPSGTLVTNTRDAVGRITTVAAKAPGASTAINLATSIGYVPFGPASMMSFFNGAGTSYTYDPDYRITAIDDVTHSGFVWDNANNVTSQSNWTYANNNATYTYDAINRLTQAYAIYGYGTFGYGFDANGNMTSISTSGSGNWINPTTYTYSSTGNQMTSANWTDPMWGPEVETMSYTGTGNLSTVLLNGSYVQFSATYNAANRLSSMGGGGSTTFTNTYDYKGQRIVKGFPTSPSTYFAYDQNSTLLEEVTNGFYVDYIYLNGRLIGLQENSTSGTALYSAVTLLNGATGAILDASASIAWGTYMMPYGIDDGTGGSLTTQSLRPYPGQYYDSGYGYAYNINRDYYTFWGRYLEPDPLGLAGGLNPYVYAGNNPVTNTDPDGLQVVLDIPILENPVTSPMVRPTIVDPAGAIPFPDTNQPDPNQPQSQRCQFLANKINNIKKDIQNREQALIANPNGLPERIGPGEALRDTIRGHRTIIQKLERQLREYENEHDRDCGCKIKA